MRRNIALSVAMLGLLAACAKPEVVEVNQTKDAALSCEEIQQELAIADSYRAKAEAENGATLTNFGAGLALGIPAIFTLQNIDKAVDAAEARKAHLQGLSRQQNCPEANGQIYRVAPAAEDGE
ncbi:MAG: hypothetical protein IT567_01055 [Alphaproteobacteria bacterium]|nr:hypothetical protein [Alphaproteobacteria bacterium]